MSSLRPTTLAASLLSLALPVLAFAQPTTVTVQAGTPGKAISPDLVGIFFEDLNYAADGGLYAELVQNRSFDYSAADFKDRNSLTAWKLVQREGAQGSLAVETADPLNPVNASYAVLTVEKTGPGAGLQNEGFHGIPVEAGDTYNA